MTFAELTDKVQRITGGLRPEILANLREAQNDFLLKTQCVQKYYAKTVTPSTKSVTAVGTNGGFASYTSTAHGLVANDWVQVYDTTYHNGLQQVTAATDANTFVTDLAYVSSETGLTAYAQYGFMFDLPSDYLDWIRVEWDGHAIQPENQYDFNYSHENDGYSPMTFGEPRFWIEGDRIRLVPYPSDDSALIVHYTYYDVNDAASPIIPALYHQYLADHAIASMFEVSGDQNRANFYLQKYESGLETVNVNRASGLLK